MSSGTLDEEGYTHYKVKHSEHLRICDASVHLPKKVVKINEHEIDKQTDWNVLEQHSRCIYR